MTVFRFLLMQNLFLSALCFMTPTYRSRRLHQLIAKSSSGNDETDALRKLLESSWNAECMGEVPSDAKAAAKEAFSAITRATENGKDLFFVDLLLPSYDVTQGSKMYDELAAIEYCIALANCLKGKSSILVRDNQILRSVGNVLDARERDAAVEPIEEFEEEEDFDNFGSLGDSDASSALDSSPAPSPATSDVDAFRQQLMVDWDGDSKDITSETPKDSSASKPKPEKNMALPLKRYRLASMFGDALISTGGDMTGDVVQAVQVNAMLTEDEETIIILSAVSREEMVAVRCLVAKYEGKKRIIMVNCKLSPTPIELRMAETVYSVLPLIAQTTTTEPNNTPPPPKIVVMRRYPRDWEVFVDIGQGFQLADTTSADRVHKNGPPMDWVAGCVKRYLQSKSSY
jgi:hypothetical protein